ncbi:hypothetical protein ACIQOU_21465 [Streptomyces sp. NPDC091279]|uniref:glycosyltransferase family 39 protein n=1 Tax=unclassified Streptomyces TaxID=2593676 RepID=UPI003829E972
MPTHIRVLAALPAVLRRPPAWSLVALWTLALGLWGLSRHHTVWRDEAATWQVARRPAADIWHLLGQVDSVHGLYYLLMHGLFTLFGPGTTTLRLPSVLATSVAAACVTVIGRHLGGSRAGNAAGFTLGLLPAVEFYLQEGRPYALIAMGASISTLLLVTSLNGLESNGRWATYAATVAVCALLNWLSLLILPAHLLTLLLARADRTTWTRWAGAVCGATACAAPLILFSRGQAQQVSWIPALTWHLLIGPAVLLALGALGALLDRSRPRRPSLTSVGLPLLAMPQLALLGISLVQPLYLDRYILFSMLGLALLIGAALDAALHAVAARAPRTRPWLLPTSIGAATLALLPQLLDKRSPESRVDDVLAVAHDVRRLKHPGDAVLFIPAARRDAALVSPADFDGLRDIALAQTPLASGTLKGVESTPHRLRGQLAAQHRVLLVTDSPDLARPPTAARDQVKLAVLHHRFRPVADRRSHGRRVTVYERRP